jgi:hypothetical protein
MAQGDKKTKQGIGEVKTDPPISSSRRGSKLTQRGMPKEEKKIVTKAGLAPPPGKSSDKTSDKATNPGLKAPPPLEDIQFEVDGDGTELNGSDAGDQEDRSKFRTAPGGGRNRVSGGRERAAVYVSPTTVAPGHGKDHITSAIKVDEVVANAVRAYETEPSLLKRRASSLPPKMPREYERSSKLVWAALIAGLLLGGIVVWLGSSLPESENPKKDRNASAQGPKQGSDAKPASDKQPSTEESAASAPPDARSKASPDPQVVQKAANETEAAPQVKPAAIQSSSPLPTPPPKTKKKPSNDLWLE